jgi:hypothetical protein
MFCLLAHAVSVDDRKVLDRGMRIATEPMPLSLCPRACAKAGRR